MESMDKLSAPGRWIRLGATTVIVALLVICSLWGGDDDFPLGPMLQFANTDPLNAPVVADRVVAVDSTGAHFELDQNNTGIRRAEVEAQDNRFISSPPLLTSVGNAYTKRHPNAPALVEIDLVRRSYALHNGRPTGAYTDKTLAVWHR